MSESADSLEIKQTPWLCKVGHVYINLHLHTAASASQQYPGLHKSHDSVLLHSWHWERQAEGGTQYDEEDV